MTKNCDKKQLEQTVKHHEGKKKFKSLKLEMYQFCAIFIKEYHEL